MPAAQMAPSQQPPGIPVLFILNLDKGEVFENFFDDIYADLISSLCDKYRVQRARTADAAQRYLSDAANRPHAILVADPAIASASNAPILEQVVRYVKAGGLSVFAASFSSFITPPDMDKFWNTWGLGWGFGNYHRTEVFLNRAITTLPTSTLPTKYSQKAIFLSKVLPENSLYSPSSESRTQSYVFPPEPADQNQTPVAFAKIEDGWIGYVGDVNNETGSQAVILSMIEFAVKKSMQTSEQSI